MTLDVQCMRCRAPFDLANRLAPNRAICPECMKTERARIDCPMCGVDRTADGPRRLFCQSCATERKNLSSRLNHHDAALRHRAAPENPPEPATLDGDEEDLRAAARRYAAGRERHGADGGRVVDARAAILMAAPPKPRPEIA